LIISLKEESNSSHVNQQYDQLTAKNDLKNAAESLYEQRRAKKWQTGKSHIDQYNLVLTVMRIVRATSESTWVSSFQRVNIHPATRVAFPEFCKKIAGFLRASESFKDESVNPTPKEKFALLPSFWHAMQPSDRKVVMTIVESYGFYYTAACLRVLHLECHLAYSQMNNIRVCVIVTQEHSETVEFNVAELGVACFVATTPQAVVASNANKSSVNNILKMLMLIPKNDAGVPLMKGEKIFDHMCHF
jgi:hypothetical protein